MDNIQKCHICDVALRVMRIGDNAMHYCQKCGRTTSIESAYNISEQSAYTA